MKKVKVAICTMLLSVSLSSAVLAETPREKYERGHMTERELDEYCEGRSRAFSSGISDYVEAEADKGERADAKARQDSNGEHVYDINACHPIASGQLEKGMIVSDAHNILKKSCIWAYHNFHGRPEGCACSMCEQLQAKATKV